MLSHCTSGHAGRRELRRQERREAILEIARQSFFELGYAGTTMSGIAARLGGSKTTLWHHFPCKEALFAAVVDRATAEFQVRVAQSLVPGTPVEDGLRRFAREFIARVISAEGVALYRLVISEVRRFPEMGRIFFDRAPRRTRDAVSGFIAASGLAVADAEIAAGQFMSLCLGGQHQKMILGLGDAIDGAEIGREADAAVAMFLAAYRG